MLSPWMLALLPPWTRGIRQGRMLSACASGGFVADLIDSRWKGIKSEDDYSGWLTKLNSGGGQHVNSIHQGSACVLLQLHLPATNSSRGGDTFHMAAKHPLNTNTACKAQCAGRERRRAGGMDECSWHCEGDGRRRGEDTAEKREGGREGAWFRRGETESVANMCVQSNRKEAFMHRWHVSIASSKAWCAVKCYQTCFDTGVPRLLLR